MPITLNFQSGYKSIVALDDIILPDFTVITGLNGSGKSQLLEAILKNDAGVRALHENTELTNRKHVTHANLAPNNSGATDPNQLRESVQNILNEFNEYRRRKLQNGNTQLQRILKNEKQLQLVNRIAEEANKTIDDLSDEDFYKHYPIDDGLTVNDVFQQNFAVLFKRYHTKFEDNLVSEYRFQKYNEGSYLKRDDFIHKYGPPPWELVNRVLEEAKVNYRINDPVGTHRDAPFVLKLINQNSDAEINFSDLSSGEKVLVSLALSLYNLNVQVDFPEVLLMDEPDAPLHPSMTKHFIEVLTKVFVQEKGVKVILTTHSPSTIALSPEESIYVMGLENPRLTKTSRDQALSILTSGVPALSVNYENRRQVFVESKYDQEFYELINRKLSSIHPSEISIDFLCAKKDGSSGCEEVKEIVGKLSEYGNSQIFGIIDWDGNNVATDRIKVLGMGNRYSIENYLLDPLVFPVYLIREKYVNKESFGLLAAENYYDIKMFTEERLSKIVDTYIKSIPDAKPDNASEETRVCTLENGLQVPMPVWYLMLQGHELEGFLKNKYRQLRKFQREGDLKRDIILKVHDDLPELFSKDFHDLFMSIRDS
ncbi:MAG: ATP-binding protein [Oceanospirillaceae bacterium]|nr:ATP-binding protein [Oceanospirillaceae bacterium]